MQTMIRYLMFADTAQGEYQQIIQAKDALEALQKMNKFLFNRGLRAGQINAVKGVWERNPLFYTATMMRHLDEE